MKTLTLKIKPSKLNFKDLKKQFNWVYPWLETNDKCREFILSEPQEVAGIVSSSGKVTNKFYEEQEIVLYYPGQTIPGGKDIYKHFAENGYELIENPHPFILVNAMKELTDEKLDELGLPSWCLIVLPTKEDLLLPHGSGYLCFLRCYRSGGGRGLGMAFFGGGWSSDCAFLLKKKDNILDKVLENTEKTDTCWNWKDALRNGYGRVRNNGKTSTTHKIVYEKLVGKIPKGMVIDHLCRNRACVNPEHLETVSNKENILRGNGLTAENHKKTKCIRGHELLGENLYTLNGKRYCKACQKLYSDSLRKKNFSPSDTDPLKLGDFNSLTARVEKLENIFSKIKEAVN